MPPRLPSIGQLGVQQAPMTIVEPFGQSQVLPHPSDMPALLPSAGQDGLQQLPP
jgi:hypothetical protein